jgi:hypothetical protein
MKQFRFCLFHEFFLTTKILGVGLLSICFWVIISLTDHDFEASGPTSSGFRILTTFVEHIPVKEVQERSDSGDTNDSFQSELDDSVEKFRHSWTSVSPYFQGSCGIALILGIIQLISSIAILTSSSKVCGEKLLYLIISS